MLLLRLFFHLLVFLLRKFIVIKRRRRVTNLIAVIMTVRSVQRFLNRKKRLWTTATLSARLVPVKNQVTKKAAKKRKSRVSSLPSKTEAGFCPAFSFSVEFHHFGCRFGDKYFSERDSACGVKDSSFFRFDESFDFYCFV